LKSPNLTTLQSSVIPRHTGLFLKSARAIIKSGVVPQQPPMILAPDFNQFAAIRA